MLTWGPETITASRRLWGLPQPCPSGPVSGTQELTRMAEVYSNAGTVPSSVPSIPHMCLGHACREQSPFLWTHVSTQQLLGQLAAQALRPGCALLMGSVTLKPDSRLSSTGQQEALRPKDPPEPLLCLPGLRGVGS